MAVFGIGIRASLEAVSPARAEDTGFRNFAQTLGAISEPLAR